MSEERPDDAATPHPSFDPTRFLSRISGADYLEVKWRLVWFRDQYPHGTIETQMVELQSDWALFRCTATAVDADGTVRGRATGYGSEAAGDFRDFIEKAESKAIGRALSHLGFGTQFAGGVGEAQRGRPVDAPVQRPGQPARRDAPPRAPVEGTQRPVAASGPDEPATPRQLRYLQAVARERGLDMAALDARSVQEFGVEAAALSRRDASTLIDLIGSAPAPTS